MDRIYNIVKAYLRNKMSLFELFPEPTKETLHDLKITWYAGTLKDIFVKGNIAFLKVDLDNPPRGISYIVDGHLKIFPEELKNQKDLRYLKNSKVKVKLVYNENHKQTEISDIELL